MERIRVCLMVAAALLAAVLSCTAKQGDEGEKGGIEALTEQAGREATDVIIRPIEKARAVDALARERMRGMEAPEDAE